MNRAANAVAIGLAVFVGLAGAGWLVFARAPPDASSQDLSITNPPGEETTAESATTTTAAATTTTSPTTANSTTTTASTESPSPTTTTKETPPTTTTSYSAPFKALAQDANRMESIPAFPAAEEAALRFMVGGILLLSTVLALTLLAGIFTGRGGAVAPLATHLPRARSTPPFQPGPPTNAPPILEADLKRGRGLMRRPRPKTVDDVLQRLSDELGGEPRVLRVLKNRLILRVYGCPDCGEAGRLANAGCGRVAGFFEKAFGSLFRSDSQIIETRCSAGAHGVCEFEVRR